MAVSDGATAAERYSEGGSAWSCVDEARLSTTTACGVHTRDRAHSMHHNSLRVACNMQRMSDGAGRGTVRCRHGIQHYAQTSEEYIAFVEKHAELKVAPRSESLVVELEPDNLFQAKLRSSML